jgi:hypothetical protein
MPILRAVKIKALIEEPFLSDSQCSDVLRDNPGKTLPLPSPRVHLTKLPHVESILRQKND